MIKPIVLVTVFFVLAALFYGYRSGKSDAFAEVAPGDIVMYSASWCVACSEAKFWLDTRSIPFEERMIDRSAQAQREFEALGGSATPLVVVRGEAMTGFYPERIETVLASSP